MKNESLPLLVDKADGICTITINRPEKLNALTPEVMDRLIEALHAVENEKDTFVVVLRGAGDEAFCSGYDVSLLDPAEEEGDPMADMVNAVRNCPVPVIAMIHGHCIGGGCALATACDIRLADSNARMGITVAKMGLVYPPSALSCLIDAVGVPAAKELLFTARLADAEEALRTGLVNRVVPPGQLEQVTYEMARRIAGNSPQAVRSAKGLIHRLQESQDAAGEYFAELQRNGATTEDLAEGKNAFLEKREPDFRKSR